MKNVCTRSEPDFKLLEDTSELNRQILFVLHEHSLKAPYYSKGISSLPGTSAVLFLIGPENASSKLYSEPCLILNKRSLKVKQAGDLCCPGGRISLRLDTMLSRLLFFPGSPLKRWPYWMLWKKNRRHEARKLALLFAAGLRESFEEMRLNPTKVTLLGPLPPQRLIMFDRVIYPMVCRVSWHRRFSPNWEVEKIVYIPLRNLLNPSNYARYRLRINISPESAKDQNNREWLCFQHVHGGETEILWGATFRVTMVFLEMVFGFKPPEIHTLPTVRGTLDANYIIGNT